MAFRSRILPFAVAIGLVVPAALALAKAVEHPAPAEEKVDVAQVDATTPEEHPIRHPLPRPSPIRPIAIG